MGRPGGTESESVCSAAGEHSRSISQMTERLAPLRDDPSVHWVDDPTVESPSDVLRWSADRWMLDHIGEGM